MKNYFTEQTVTPPELTVQEGLLTITQVESAKWRWNFEDVKIQRSRSLLVLVGESVASGYFYRPELTFADILREFYPDHDVIDLSRVDLPFGDVLKFRPLLEKLSPEGVILFAGNNDMTGKGENPETLEWLFQMNTNLQVIVPGFNFTGWPALQETIGLEALSPRITHETKKMMLNLAKKYQVEVVQVEEMGLAHDELYLDYCHLTRKALYKLAGSLSAKSIPVPENHLLEQKARKRAFFHCYGFGQFKLSLEHLKKIKGLGENVDYRNFVSTLYTAIFSGASPLLLENLFDHVSYPGIPALESKQNFFLPPTFLEEYLREEARKTITVSLEKRLNLLEERNCLLSKKHLIHPVYTDPYLQRVSYGVSFKAYFLQASIGKNPKLKSLVSENSYSIALNGKSLGASEGEIPLSLDLLSFYNEITITVKKADLTDEEIRKRGRFRVHLLEIISD